MKLVCPVPNHSLFISNRTDLYTAEKQNREFDDLTPLDARNSLLMDPVKMPMSNTFTDQKNPHTLTKTLSEDSFASANPYGRDNVPMKGVETQRSSLLGRRKSEVQEESREHLVAGAAPLGGHQNTEYRGYQY